jgi:hypothetical protein
MLVMGASPASWERRFFPFGIWDLVPFGGEPLRAVEPLVWNFGFGIWNFIL